MIRVSVLAVAVMAWFWAMPDPGGSPYCEMVTIYNQSGGEHGWPDYRGTYKQECK